MMLCQRTTSCHLGDDPIHSAQHEYRFPTIIQLDEVAPPSPSSRKPLLSPVPSSSQSYDYYTSSEEYEEVEDDEDEEEATESYCSSDPTCPGVGVGDSERASAMASAPVEQKAKMSRVLAWRNSFDSVFADDNAGMSRPRLLPHLWDPVPTPFLRFLRSSGFGSVNGSHVSDSPVTLASHVPLPLFCFFLTLPSISSGVNVIEAEILARVGRRRERRGWDPTRIGCCKSILPSGPSPFQAYPRPTCVTPHRQLNTFLLAAIPNPLLYLAHGRV